MADSDTVDDESITFTWLMLEQEEVNTKHRWSSQDDRTREMLLCQLTSTILPTLAHDPALSGCESTRKMRMRLLVDVCDTATTYPYYLLIFFPPPTAHTLLSIPIHVSINMLVERDRCFGVHSPA